MKIKRVFVSTLAVSGLLLFLLPNLSAQVKGNIVWAEYQKPDPVRKAQYEAARKEKLKWHRDKNDPLPLYVWEVVSGERTGQYLVAVSVKDWEVFDSTPVSIEENKKRFMETFKTEVMGVRTFFMDHLVEVSRNPDMETPAPMTILRYYKVAYGKWGDFYNLLRKFREAAEVGEWPVRYSWFSVNNGAEEPMFVEAIPKKNWADMSPPAKAPLQLAMDLFGPEETISMTNLMSVIVEKEDSEILRYRPDLSYIPESGQ